MKTLDISSPLSLAQKVRNTAGEPVFLNENGKKIGVILSLSAFREYKTLKNHRSVDQTVSLMNSPLNKAQTFLRSVEQAHTNAKTRGYDINVAVDEEDYYKQYL